MFLYKNYRKWLAKLLESKRMATVTDWIKCSLYDNNCFWILVFSSAFQRMLLLIFFSLFRPEPGPRTILETHRNSLIPHRTKKNWSLSVYQCAIYNGLKTDENDWSIRWIYAKQRSRAKINKIDVVIKNSTLLRVRLNKMLRFVRFVLILDDGINRGKCTEYERWNEKCKNREQREIEEEKIKHTQYIEQRETDTKTINI